MASAMSSTGIAADSIPTASPWMMLVAAPVSLASAMRRIGLAAV